MTAADRNHTADALDAAIRVCETARNGNDDYELAGWPIPLTLGHVRDAARLLRTPDTPTDSEQCPTCDRKPLPATGMRGPSALCDDPWHDTPADSDAAARARRLAEWETSPAARRLITDLLAEVDRLNRWKAEGTEVIESWERVYEALGDVGGLGQRRSDAVLAEVLRMKAELDRLNASADERVADVKALLHEARNERDAAVARADTLTAAIADQDIDQCAICHDPYCSGAYCLQQMVAELPEDHQECGERIEQVQDWVRLGRILADWAAAGRGADR